MRRRPLISLGQNGLTVSASVVRRDKIRSSLKAQNVAYSSTHKIHVGKRYTLYLSERKRLSARYLSPIVFNI